MIRGYVGGADAVAMFPTAPRVGDFVTVNGRRWRVETVEWQILADGDGDDVTPRARLIVHSKREFRP